MLATVDRRLLWQIEEADRCTRRVNTGRGPRPAQKPKEKK